MRAREWDATRSPARRRQIAWLGGYKLADLIPACEEHLDTNPDADCDACLLLTCRVPEEQRNMLEIKAPLTLVYGEFMRDVFLDAVRFQREHKDSAHDDSRHVVSHLLGRRVTEVEYMALVGDYALRDIAGVMSCLTAQSSIIVLDGLLDRLHPNACKRMMEYLGTQADERGISIVVASNSAAPLVAVPKLVPYEDVVVIDDRGAHRMTDLRSEAWLDNFTIASLFVPGGFQSLKRSK